LFHWLKFFKEFFLTLSVNYFTLNIQFKTSSLEKLCNNSKKLINKFGSATAKNISERLDLMKAALVLEDLRHAPGNYHVLKHDRHQQIAVSINKTDRIIFEPLEDPIPFLPDNVTLDWSKISNIIVIDIENYHKTK